MTRMSLKSGGPVGHYRSSSPVLYIRMVLYTHRLFNNAYVVVSAYCIYYNINGAVSAENYGPMAYRDNIN